ncbi:MAG: ABC transporter ATP-binding protein/permease [Candidatus Adiutrix sp.]|jgi:ABC-type multidrug transport system fused ATPase/permease subunit|nr:ABC transporter ATP-binding protein/permease [Candidatus Adiutrix sp.]
MNLFTLNRLPLVFYRDFLQAGRRLYLLLPGPLRRRFWRVLLLQVLSALIETSALLAIAFFTVSVAAPASAFNHFIFQRLISLWPFLRDWCADHRHLIMFTSLLVSGFIFFKVVLGGLVARQTAFFSEEVSHHIGRETLRRYLNKNYLWHISPASRAVIHKFGQRRNLAKFLTALLLVYSQVLCCLALFISLFLVTPRLTLVVGAVFTAGGLSTYLFLRRRLELAGRKSADLDMAESADRQALTQGLREILIHRRQEAFFKKMLSTMAAGRGVKAFLAYSGYLPSHVLELLGFGTITALTVGQIVSGVPMPVIVSSLSMLMLTAWRVLPAVSRTLRYLVTIQGLRPAALSCLELLETFITGEPEARPKPDPDFRFEKSLALAEAAFTYPEGRRPALAGLNLALGRGEKVGLIGLSGAGKSTLALLLSGLVEPEKGRFLVDGRELTPAGRAAYARLVGFVPQNPLLLPGTVADNVAFSQWGEQYDRPAVEAACRRAAMDFALDNPEGLERRLGPGGQGLSGGQAQRVAIARALFARPEIIIFDEATAALDQACENIIASTIAGLSEKTTVVIIAHRLTTVENCGRLIWLEDGRVRAEGPPAEILPLYLAATSEKSRE